MLAMKLTREGGEKYQILALDLPEHSCEFSGTVWTCPSTRVSLAERFGLTRALV
jgi:hypothetical protein